MYDGMRESRGQETVPEMSVPQPFFLQPGYAGVLEKEREAERELRKLQSLYPDAAKRMLPYVEEECDKMEYEGSPMFDEYPDRTTVYRVEKRIYDCVRDQFPEEPAQEPEEVLAMQYEGPDGKHGRSWARDLVRVLLLQEMHHRRCRHAAVHPAPGGSKPPFSDNMNLPFPPVGGIV